LCIISSFVIIKLLNILRYCILSTNSGIIDIDADLNVYRVNKIVCPGSYAISKHKSIFIEYDLPDPLPPVTIKYLLELFNVKYL
tara:strand:+ start:8674 stop:8925 length:252 start_codon:yes stop_codon:yes gene_type:complete